MSEHTLYSIGEVARRTGLSVSAVRYYADEGLVHPTEATGAGHRLYDVDAITRLEFVRTLRDLDTGIEQVREVLSGTSSLRDVLAEHLDVIEKRTADMQGKRAVLRALVRERSTAQRANLLHKLVRMSDTERQRLVDDFLEEVAEGLPAEAAVLIREARPQLPTDPTSEQLDAWITLAELLRDGQFRDATRTSLRQTHVGPSGELMATPEVQDFIHAAGHDVMPQLVAAHAAGLSADDPHVVTLATQFVEQIAKAFEPTDGEKLRQRLAERYRDLASITRDALQDDSYTATEGRYLELVATINQQPHPDEPLLHAARNDRSISSGTSFDDFGPWVSTALLATG